MPSLAPFGQAVSEEKIFLTIANQKKELMLAAMFVGRMEPNRGSYIAASCQAVSEEKIFLNSTQYPIRNKNCPWWPYLLVERNEMEKLYRGPYCQVWFYLAKLFQRRRLKYEKVNGRTTDAK